MGITLTKVGDDVIDRPVQLGHSIKAQRVIAQIERNFGGRDTIITELLRAPSLTPQLRTLLELLYDPRFDQQPLVTLCAKVGLTPGDVFAAFRDATIATAHIQAVRLIAAQFPQVVAAVVESATDHYETCPSCQGTKAVRVLKSKSERTLDDKYDSEPCDRCKETGKIFVKADADQQEKVMEIMGLLKKNSGFQLTDNSTTINQTQNNLQTGTSVGTSLFDLQKAVGTVLHRKALTLVPRPEEAPSSTDAPVIDAQILSESPV